MEFLNEQIIRTGFFITLILILIPFGKISRKQKSLLIANTKYVKKLPRYKMLNSLYIFSIVLVILGFFSTMMVGFFLNARLVEVNEEIHEENNRDIFLCIEVGAFTPLEKPPSPFNDVAYSLFNPTKETVVNLKKFVKKLDGDRVGIMIFFYSSVILSPLTDDYDFILDVLDKIIEAIEERTWVIYTDNDGIKHLTIEGGSYMLNGTTYGNHHHYAVGDALVTCVNTFANTDRSAEGLMTEDRTRIIILATYSAEDKGLFTLKEAADYAKSENIVVHGIIPKIESPEEWKDKTPSVLESALNKQKNFRAAVEKIGGKVYIANHLDVDDIINDINRTNKSFLKTEKEIIKIELPEYSFHYLLIAFGIYIVFSRKIRL